MLYLPISCFSNIKIYEGTRRERDETVELVVRQLDGRKVVSRRRHIIIYIFISFISININTYIVIFIFIFIYIYIMHCKICICIFCIVLHIIAFVFPTLICRISAFFNYLLILSAIDIYLLANGLKCNAYT